MKITKLLAIALLLVVQANSQTSSNLSLDSCYALAKKNYPLLKQMVLLEKSKDYSIDNASKAYLPQINFAGQATYQSEVTKIPIVLPGINIKELNKDQYKVYAEINQSLSDPILIKQQKELIQANTKTEEEKISVELYKIKDRINQLYFGILILDAQRVQTELLMKDLEVGIKKTEAAITNGTALKSQADLLQAELLKVEQRLIELKSSRKAFSDMLSVFINQQITETESLPVPVIQSLN
ncbi:MAG: TolC family protein, partial [Bacteroidota bacterium]